jgi:hypothetical protein
MAASHSSNHAQSSEHPGNQYYDSRRWFATPMHQTRIHQGWSPQSWDILVPSIPEVLVLILEPWSWSG